MTKHPAWSMGTFAAAYALVPLAFTGVRPPMKVLDVATGGGYSTELMARGVGPAGVVYGQDATSTIARACAAFEVRAKSPAMKNVVRLLRSFDDAVPADVRDLDLITFIRCPTTSSC